MRVIYCMILWYVIYDMIWLWLQMVGSWLMVLQWGYTNWLRHIVIYIYTAYSQWTTTCKNCAKQPILGWGKTWWLLNKSAMLAAPELVLTIIRGDLIINRREFKSEILELKQKTVFYFYLSMFEWEQPWNTWKTTWKLWYVSYWTKPQSHGETHPRWPGPWAIGASECAECCSGCLGHWLLGGASVLHG